MVKKVKNKILNFLKQLVKSPERIEFLAYIKENNIQSVSLTELKEHFERPDELKDYLKSMVKLGLLNKQIIDQENYYSYNPTDAEVEDTINRFYKNYTTAKNIFYKKAEQDFYEKSRDIRKDKEVLDEQVKDLEIFTSVGEEVQKIFRLDELFEKVPHFCIEYLGFESAEVYMKQDDDQVKLISLEYSDGSHEHIDIDEFNVELNKNKAQLDQFKQVEKELSFLVSKAVDNNLKHIKNEIIITKIIEEEQITGYILAGYGDKHRRMTDRDTSRMAVFNNTISIALSTVRLFDELDKKVQQRTEELNKANSTLKLSNQKMEAINKEMQRELKVASSIQTSMIPKEFPKYPNVKLGAVWQSMTEVSGDYYDVIPIPSKKKIGFLVADVSGHGVPAALITTMAKVSFGSHSQTAKNTAEVCDHANKEIYESLGDIGFYLTAFFGIFDARTNELMFTNAGHQMSIWQHAKTGELELITSPGFFIGSFDEVEYGYNTITLEKGDKVMFFTDGIVEARRDPDGEFYEEERLNEFFHKNKDLHADEFAKKLFEEVEEFCNGRPPNDDRTIMVIECTDDPMGENINNFENMYEVKTTW